MMRRLAGMAALCGGLWAAASAQAQGHEAVVLVVDTGQLRINVEQLTQTLASTLQRDVIRITDERAQGADGRLTIAYSSPQRWVLRYEAAGQVGWISDRITRPGLIRQRLAQLTQDLVARVEGAPVTTPTPQREAAVRAPPTRRRSASDWTDDVILALQNEIVDPFPDDPHRSRPRPISVLWSEVVDPFQDRPPRAHPTEVWSEVLDPWATEVRRRRR